MRHQRLQIDLQIGISLIQRISFSIACISLIQTVFILPYIGHTVSVCINNLRSGIQNRISSCFGRCINEFTGFVANIIDDTRIRSIPMKRTTRLGKHGLIGIICCLFIRQKRHTIRPTRRSHTL